MADTIEAVYKNGARFDGWSESFDWDAWLAAFESNNVDPEQSVKAMPFSTDLPWSHIDKGPSAEHLEQERQRTRQLPRLEQFEDLTPEEIEVLEARAWMRAELNNATTSPPTAKTPMV